MHKLITTITILAMSLFAFNVLAEEPAASTQPSEKAEVTKAPAKKKAKKIKKQEAPATTEQAAPAPATTTDAKPAKKKDSGGC